MASCPGLHFAVIICTNSAKRDRVDASPSIGRLSARSPRSRGAACPAARTFIIDLAIAVNVSLPDHLIHLLIRQLLPQVRHDVAQLGGTDIAIPILGFGAKACHSPPHTLAKGLWLCSLAPVRGLRAARLTLSNTRKASRISSSLSVSFIFLAIMVRNSGKSMVPFPGGGEADVTQSPVGS